MAWGMSFERDAEHDVVTANFTDCILVSDEDVFRWRDEVEAQFAKFNGRVDLLINLNGLIVRHTAGRTFGKVRREVLERNTHRSYRYGGDQMTLMYIGTSGVINGAAVNHFPTREAALAALLAERESLRKRGFTPFLPGVVTSKR
ncbi:hypothetical protein COCOR_07902 [Corallococcus coralloides DSM 2259]|uniref:Uncharacterized protein n=1 Tax=Corallococcus coralloides (strain ATCC 25202 / DSM 2259 / NBRC 100086 / M2) TaxID=1144275 RepID=H8MWF7_CORCM|nr:hypothetical protein [Corallococcus coralloides]AFE07806.1 hypothetical protein COCOR_07902 [Corallococcus coralloides DSM 2259]